MVSLADGTDHSSQERQRANSSRKDLMAYHTMEKYSRYCKSQEHLGSALGLQATISTRTVMCASPPLVGNRWGGRHVRSGRVER